MRNILVLFLLLGTPTCFAEILTVDDAETAVRTAAEAVKTAKADLDQAQKLYNAAKADKTSGSEERRVAAEENLNTAKENLRAAEKEHAKALKVLGAVKEPEDLNDPMEALGALFVSILTYAILLAAGHFIGSFFDPMTGLIFSVIAVIYATITIFNYSADGQYIYAMVNLIAVAIAGYTHFTKTLAIA